MSDDPHYAAIRRLALRTSRVVREPLHDLVGKPRTQRYFLKALRRTLPGFSDEQIREAAFALEMEFQPPELDEPISSPVWLGHVRTLLREMEPGRFYKLFELTRLARQRCKWHREFALNVVIVAEDRGILEVVNGSHWKRRSTP